VSINTLCKYMNRIYIYMDEENVIIHTHWTLFNLEKERSPVMDE
jgi:hypothetical protein